MLNDATARILMIAKWFLLTAIFAAHTNVRSNFSVDSVQLEKNSESTMLLSEEEQMKQLLSKAAATNMSDFDQALKYSKQAMQLAEKLQNPKAMGMAFNLMGIAYFHQAKYDSAHLLYKEGLSIFEKLKDTTGIIHINNNLGIEAKTRGDYKSSVYFYDRVLKIAERMQNRQVLAFAHNNLAIVYYEWKEYEAALTHYHQSLDLLQTLNDSSMMASVQNNIGELHKVRGDTASALRYFKDALKIASLGTNQKTLMNTYLNIGDILLEGNSFSEAQANYKTAFAIASKLKYDYGIAYTHIQMGKALLQSKQLTPAFNELTSGLNLALQLKNLQLQKDAHELLFQYYLLTNDYQTALQQQLLFSKLKDSIYDINAREELSRLRTEYETTKKEKEIAILNQDKANQQLEIGYQKNLRIITTLAALFLMLVSYLLYLRYRMKQQKIKVDLERKNMEIEQRLLRSQMNPHFIFNSLNSINSYILINDHQTAQVFLKKFSELIRLILENSRKSMISLEDEIRTLQLNLELEQSRFTDAFQFSITIEPDLILQDTYVPPMLIQPFVENAILHGLSNKKEKGQIDIELKKSGQMLLATVSDNGIGRAKAGENNESRRSKTHQSLGLQLTNERLSLLSSKFRQNFHFSIVDLKDGQDNAVGTRVNIYLPFEVDD